MKILIAADVYYPIMDGCSCFTQRLAHYLTKAGHQVLVIAPSETFVYTDRKIHGIRVYGVRSFPIMFYPKRRFCILPFYNKRLESIVEHFQPDVIHCQFHFAINRAILKIAKRKGIPTVATNHFMPENMLHYIPFSSLFSTAMTHYCWKKVAKIYQQMDQITVPTKIAASLIQPYFLKPILPISCGIDLTRFRPNLEHQFLYAKYTIPQKPTLLYVGRLDREKNLDFVLYAVARALHQVDFQFVIAGGTGSEQQALKKLAEKLNILDAVIFTGFISNEDLPNLYCLADCFIAAGIAELQSIATMEAMACGLPILAARAVALPELVEHGKNGLLFRPTDQEELITGIKTIFNNRRLGLAMGQQSCQRIAKHDINHVIHEFEHVYHDVAHA